VLLSSDYIYLMLGCFNAGMTIRWDYVVNQYDAARYVSSTDGRQFVREFASVVSILQDKTNSVIDLYKDILRAVEDLATCPYTNEAFSELLAKIQAAVSSIVACYLGTIC
jgi:hypothetical protein